MKIHRNQIPDEGLHLEGIVDEKDKDYLDLPGEDIAQAGPLRYSLDVGQHGSGVWAAGALQMDVEQTCVRCLRRFVMPVDITNFGVQKEAMGKEAIDLTPEIREDILLALPANPDCHRHGGLKCEGLALEHFEAGTPGNSESGQESEAPNPWSSLDELKIEPDRKP
jgi:uncharacterized metal-binding protein YceD (DUF177 family)